MKSQKPNSNGKPYDLEERTARFGELVIDFAKSLETNTVTGSLINQLIRSSTSIGANYLEADSASSKKDFRYKISLCRKESKETKHWLRMLARAIPARQMECRKIWQEAQELTLIFSAILRSCKP